MFKKQRSIHKCACVTKAKKKIYEFGNTTLQITNDYDDQEKRKNSRKPTISTATLVNSVIIKHPFDVIKLHLRGRQDL